MGKFRGVPSLIGEADAHLNPTPVKQNGVKAGQRGPRGRRGWSRQPALTGDATGASDEGGDPGAKAGETLKGGWGRRMAWSRARVKPGSLGCSNSLEWGLGEERSRGRGWKDIGV